MQINTEKTDPVMLHMMASDRYRRMSAEHTATVVYLVASFTTASTLRPFAGAGLGTTAVGGAGTDAVTQVTSTVCVLAFIAT